VPGSGLPHMKAKYKRYLIDSIDENFIPNIYEVFLRYCNWLQRDRLNADPVLNIFGSKKMTYITHGHFRKTSVSYSMLIRYGL
jgi:hypothetical protein